MLGAVADYRSIALHESQTGGPAVLAGASGEKRIRPLHLRPMVTIRPGKLRQPEGPL